MSEPNRLTKFMVDKSCCFFFSALALLLLISVVVAVLGWLNPSPPNNRDYLVWGDPYVTNLDKSILAKRELLLSQTNEKVTL